MDKSKKVRKTIERILYSLLVIFILILFFFISPFDLSSKRIFFLILGILGLLFLAIGIILIILSKKEKGKLRRFLILTGISAISPLVFTILHNLFYALAVSFEKLAFLFEPLHALFFIISLIVAPITFIIGLIGSIILLKK